MNPTKRVMDHYHNSKQITAPLIKVIIQQEKTCSNNISAEQATIKQRVKLARRKDLTDEARRLHEEQTPKMQRAMDLDSEKGPPKRLILQCSLPSLWVATTPGCSTLLYKATAVPPLLPHTDIMRA